MKWVISKVQESDGFKWQLSLALKDLQKKSGLNVKKNDLKYNYFWPIGGAVTKLIENCHGIVAQNKEKYLISVGQSIKKYIID